MMTRLLARFPLALFALLLLSRAALGAASHEQALLRASGVPAERVAGYLAQVDRLAAEFESFDHRAADADGRAQSLHAFMHRRVLRGSYLASASDVGFALDGGAFNCVACTILLSMLCERSGLEATPMSTRGHVWCRIHGNTGPIDVETTSRDWFVIVARYRGVPTSQVSPAMAAHRRRVHTGRELDQSELLAVLHFNRGVTRIRENRLPEAALANLQAVSLDPDCQPAWENLAAVRRSLPATPGGSLGLDSRLIFWAIDQAAHERQPALVGR
jgi:hypothetical protein